MVFGPPKGGRSKRTVALDPLTVAALREHKQRQAAEIMAFGRADWPDHELAFTREDGEPIHPAWFTRAFQQRVRSAGLPAVRLYDLRHGHVLALLAAGVDPRTISERLGHSSVSFTLDVYGHSNASLHSEAAQKAAAVVFGG